MLRVKLTNKVVEELLNKVEDLGRTRISEDAGINRGELNDKCISRLKLFRLVRVLVAIRFYMGDRQWQRWWNHIGELITTITTSYETYYRFVDENRKRESRTSAE